MSYVEYAFLHAPLHDAIHLYKKEIAPILLNNNKVIAIVAALSLIYFIQDRVLKPPSNLRHLPYLSCFGVIKSMSSKESFWSRCYNAHLPIIDAKNSKGLFMVRFYNQTYHRIIFILINYILIGNVETWMDSTGS